MKKCTAHLPEYPRTSSESKNKNLREQNGSLNIFYIQKCLVECPYVFHHSPALEQFLTLLWLLLYFWPCQHLPWSPVVWTLPFSQLSCVLHLVLLTSITCSPVPTLFANPAPDHMQLKTSWTAWCSLSAKFPHSSSSVLAPCSPSPCEEWGTEWHGNNPNKQPPHSHTRS